MSEREARDKHGEAIKVLRWKLAENDRAQTDRETEGMVKAITDRHGRILGGDHRRTAGRRADPAVVPGDRQAPEDLGAGELRAALSDPGRGQQARRRQLLHRHACSARARAVWCGSWPGCQSGEGRYGEHHHDPTAHRHRRRGLRRPERRARPGRRACRRHRHRPAQLPSLPAAALPGGDRRPVAGADRLADPRHPAPRGQRPASCWARSRRSTRSAAPSRSRIAPSPTTISCLATGARHSYFGHDDWESVAPGLKKIDDATGIRRRILTAFEHAEAAATPERAAALPHLRRDRRRRRPAWRWPAPSPSWRAWRCATTSATSIPRDGAHRAGRGGPARCCRLSRRC